MLPNLNLQEMEELRKIIKSEYKRYSIGELNQMGIAFSNRLEEIRSQDPFINLLRVIKDLFKKK